MTRKTLAEITLLKGLESAERERLEQLCTWRRFRSGERIIDRGSLDRDVYFIVDGVVRIVDFAQSGREISFGIAEQGATIGELAAIDGQPRSASVIAARDSLLAILGPEPFVDLLERHGSIGFRLLQQLAQVVRQGSGRMRAFEGLQVTERIYKELLAIASPHETVSELWVIDPLPPLRELARRVHASPEQVAGVLKQLYPSGLVRRQGKSLYLMELSALRKLIDTAKANSISSKTGNGESSTEDV